MIEVPVEVLVNGSHLRATVRAESIEYAVGLARDLYPDGEIRVSFPIPPESFFVRGSATKSVDLKTPEKVVV